MADRGEILALRRGIGFLAGERLEAFLVVQSGRLSSSLDTVIVVPLDLAVAEYAGLPGIVSLAPTEVGEWKAWVAVVPQLAALPLERFAPDPAGRIRPSTLARIDRALRIVLEL